MCEMMMEIRYNVVDDDNEISCISVTKLWNILLRLRRQA